MPRTLFALVAATIAMLWAPRAEAQNFRSFVAGGGAGTLCLFAAPCPSLQAAHDATTDGGTVECLAGGVGVLTNVAITKSITIDCPYSNFSVIVNAPGIIVTLRNMTITSFGNGFTGGVGIDFQNGAALIVDHCTIEQFDPASVVFDHGPGIGIRFAPQDVTAKLHVMDSVISRNGLASSGGGIIVQPSGSGSARVVIERTRVENNTYGIFANGTNSTGLISVQVRDSVVSNSMQSGISSFTLGGPSHSIVSTVVDRSSSLLNGANGILAQGANAFVFLSESTVMSNVTGLNAFGGGAIFSYQNNRLTGNVTDGAPTGVLTVK